MGIAKQEAQIKQIDALHGQLATYRPYEGDRLVQLRKYYRLGLTWTSNAIEGSSYTESETKILLEDGITVAGKTLRETMAALGHAKAYDYMFTLIGKKGVSEQDILAMHGMLDGGMETGTAGEYRTTAVFVTGTTFKFPPAGEIPVLMQTLFAQTMPGFASLAVRKNSQGNCYRSPLQRRQRPGGSPCHEYAPYPTRLYAGADLSCYPAGLY